MAEALFRIPSRTVQYGYVEIEVEGDFGSSPEILAAHYVSYVYAFQKEEQATVERLKNAPSGAVKAPLAASEPEVDHPVDPVDRAAQMVAEGLGGATEVDDVIEETIKKAEEIEAKAPWKQEVATPKKPWEAEATAPKAVVTEDW